MIKVLMADDHTIVRQGMKLILSDTDDIALFGEASSGLEVLEMAEKEDFDIILLDISMPDMDGLDALKLLRAKEIKVPVLILSVYPEEQYAKRVLKAGAAGYLTKASAPDELVGAIRKVAQGNKYVSSALAERLANEILVSTIKHRHEVLSDREYQIMCLIAKGMTPKLISDKLSISAKTINTYRGRILSKMKFKSNADIVSYTINNSLI